MTHCRLTLAEIAARAAFYENPGNPSFTHRLTLAEIAARAALRAQLRAVHLAPPHAC